MVYTNRQCLYNYVEDVNISETSVMNGKMIIYVEDVNISETSVMNGKMVINGCTVVANNLETVGDLDIVNGGVLIAPKLEIINGDLNIEDSIINFESLRIVYGMITVRNSVVKCDTIESIKKMNIENGSEVEMNHLRVSESTIFIRESKFIAPELNHCKGSMYIYTSSNLTFESLEYIDFMLSAATSSDIAFPNLTVVGREVCLGQMNRINLGRLELIGGLLNIIDSKDVNLESLTVLGNWLEIKDCEVALNKLEVVRNYVRVFSGTLHINVPEIGGYLYSDSTGSKIYARRLKRVGGGSYLCGVLHADELEEVRGDLNIYLSDKFELHTNNPIKCGRCTWVGGQDGDKDFNIITDPSLQTTGTISTDPIVSKDGKYLIADGLGSKIIHRRGNIFMISGMYNKSSYFILGDNGEHAHGETVRSAYESLNFKYDNKLGLLVEKTKDYIGMNLNKKMSVTEAINCYRTITLACDYGITDFLYRRGISLKSTETYSVWDINKLTKGLFGNEKFMHFFIFNGRQQTNNH